MNPMCQRNPTASALDYPTTAEPIGYHQLHHDRGLEFQLNRFLTLIGPSALEELREAAASINTYDDWITCFLDMAETARAGEQMLAAACYDRAAEFFMKIGDPRRGPALQRFLVSMREVYGLEPIQVPFGDAALPAYDVRPGDTPRGTIVVTGGFDGSSEEGFSLLVSLANAGYRAITFDGPGQGMALEDCDLPMIPEWEQPISAILDYFELDDVTLIGVSLGGGLAIRAAAFERRVRRVVAFDILDDFLECIGRQIGPGATPLLRLLLAVNARPIVNRMAMNAAARNSITDWGLRHGMHVTGTSDSFGFFQAARDLNTRGISDRVVADALLLAGADDHYVPVSQLHRQAAALTGARSVSTRLFTQVEQAQNHCQVGNIGLAVRTIVTWIESLQPPAVPG